MSGVRLEGLTKRFGEIVTLDHLDLDIAAGSFTILVGPSGCGKTTTLRMLAGLEEVSEGRIRIAGRDVTGLEPRARNVAMVFQNYALYPHMTVYDNIAFGLRARSLAEAEIRRRIEEVSEMLGITPLLARRPRQLSGGQQQRVAIGRAIVREPDLFLFDEPLSNLDAKLRVAMRTELVRLQKRLGTTTVYVTHDQEEAMTMGDRIAVLEAGRLQQYGTPREIYFRPRNLAVARFVGSPAMNILQGRLAEGRFLGEGVDIPLTTPTGMERPVLLGVRPDDIHLARQEESSGTVPARVEVIELLGARAVVTVTAGERELKAVFEERELESLREGTRIHIAFDPGRLHFFDPESGERLEPPTAT